MLFSKLKTILRRAKVRAIDTLITAMGEALRAIRPTDITGWFAHGGYRPRESTARGEEKLL